MSHFPSKCPFYPARELSLSEWLVVAASLIYTRQDADMHTMAATSNRPGELGSGSTWLRFCNTLSGGAKGGRHRLGDHETTDLST